MTAHGVVRALRGGPSIRVEGERTGHDQVQLGKVMPVLGDEGRTFGALQRLK